MTPQQFERWKEFSLNMAAGYPGATEGRRSKVKQYVQEFLECVEDGCQYRFVVSWDKSLPSFQRYGDLFRKPDRCRTMCISDWFTEWSDRLPGYWSDSIQAKFEKEKDWKFEIQINCCIRAGLDVAGVQSAGVVGFTVGDIKSWFGGTIPTWITEQFSTDMNSAPADAGVLL